MKNWATLVHRPYDHPTTKFRLSEAQQAEKEDRSSNEKESRTPELFAAAVRVVPTFHAGCLCVRQFASEHGLVGRPHTLLWLARTYAIPASMYTSKIWGTVYMEEGAETDCPLQTGHLYFLKRVLPVEVKQTTCSWTVLRECGQVPLQLSWFRAAIRSLDPGHTGGITTRDHPRGSGVGFLVIPTPNP
eukprot:1160736-Pelagomonas_calceolata.AAC.16